MGRHRHDEDVSGADRTEILPLVKQRRLTASPLLLAAGAVALTLVLGVVGWALLGSRSGGDPLVFPWSADKPGDIDVSVSMVPTTDPTLSEQDSPSPLPARSTTAQRSAPQQVPLSPVSAGPPGSAAATAKVASVSGWNGSIKINVDVHNAGSMPLTTWSVELWFDKAVTVDDLWNAKAQVVGDRAHLKFIAERPLAASETVSFGFVAGYPGNHQPRMQTCQIDGRVFSCKAD